MTRRAALGLVAALLGVAALVAVLLPKDERRVTVGQNRFVNPPQLIDANNSPSVARNPERPANVVTSHRRDLPTFSAEIEWSDNGGLTWQPTELPLPAGRDRPFAPDVAFGPDGTLYVSYVNLEGPGNRPQTLWLSTSADGGRTLTAPVEVAGRLSFQARLVVDDKGTIHITWLKVSDVAPLAIVEGDNPIVTVRSEDGGRTFSEQVRVSDSFRQRVGAASPVIDGDGQLVVLYEDFKDDRRDFQNLDGPVWERPFGLVVARSADGGRTFQPGLEFESNVVPLTRFLVFLPEFPSLAAGPGRSLYAAWADGRHGDQDVFVRRSTDGGLTWRPAVRIGPTEVGDGTAQYLPRVDVAPDGRVDVLYLDRRRDPSNIRADAQLAVSRDNGSTFDDLRLSSKSFDSRVGFAANSRFEADFGSRLGLASTDHEALAAWTDTRFGSEDTGRQDIASARIIHSGGSGGVPTAVVLVLVLLSGLALAGSLVGGTRGRVKS